MNKNSRKGMAPWLLALCCVAIAGIAAGVIRYFSLKEKYAGQAVAYSRQQVQLLSEDSGDYDIARSFYTDAEWEAIRSDTAVTITEDTTQTDEETPVIEFQHVTGSTYDGWMMLVHDPDLVKVAVNPNMDSGTAAPDLAEYIEMYGAIGGINGGGFEDAGGTGNGGLAYGIVIHEGQLISGGLNEYQQVIGIDADGRLQCAGMTGQQALDWGIQEAVTFGPTLINNYSTVYEEGQGDVPRLNPRTAIGQQEDGTFLLLVLDGRGPASFGALYQDIVDVMYQFGARTASNLDGGNSTAMIFNGEYVNNTVSMYGSRNLPTAFVVMKEGS